MATQVNHVTLFSNGIGHFRRMYQVPAESYTISIPFLTASIGDVAASLQVFGKVRTSPPSFTPANSNATSLKIDSRDALKSLLQQLSGAAVAITMAGGSMYHAVLLGLDEETVYTASGQLEEHYMVLQTLTGIQRQKLANVNQIDFTEDSVKAEIAKARKCNFQKIKPDSTLLELSLASLTGNETEAVVQYTIPVAAWKMRYAIRQEGVAFTLEGAAIIDNNTDEDWDNFSVSVVTGNPISFLTDIANVVVPQRRFVSVVDIESLGNVSVESGVPNAAVAKSTRARGAVRNIGPKMSLSNVASFGMESLGTNEEVGSEIMMDFMEVAESPGVDAKEVGDFCVFTHKEPITILARKSAVVPMFTVALSHAGVVLLYKEQNHARRPYRAIKFKNETTYSLGTGKTIIYNDGIFSGECVLETAKPGENRMLPHCLENGVKIVKEPKGLESRRNSIQISDGAAMDEQVQTAVTEYVVENKKAEPFKLALEHVNVLSQANVNVAFDGVEIKESEKLSTGYRLYFELDTEATLTLRVTEVAVQGTRVILSHNFGWLVSTISVCQPLADDKQVKKCIDIQAQIDDNNTASQEAALRKTELDEQGGRVRQNLAAIKGQSADLTAQWVQDLDATELAIRKITKETLPDLQRRNRELQIALREELKKIAVTWQEKPQDKPTKRKS